MNIIVIQNDNPLLDYITDWLEKTGYNISYIEAQDNPGEEYLGRLMMLVKSTEPVCVFSLNFYKTVSLACGALGVKYVTWILDAFLDSSYDLNIKNPWNEVYIADADLYNIIKGDDSIKYLPLGITSPVKNSESSTPTKDILIWSDVYSDSESFMSRMDNLKDSTKGYIDSMLEQVRGTLTEWKVYYRFADYIKKDIEDNYPLEADSLEPVFHKYDRLFFLDSLKHTYAFPYLVFASAPWSMDTQIDFAVEDSSKLTVNSEKIGKLLTNNLIDADYKEVFGYKIVVYFPSIENGNKIPTELWNFMAGGVPVLIPAWIDTSNTPKVCVKKIKNKREMRNILYSFLEEESSLKEYADKMKKSVGTGQELSDRLECIFK